MKLVEYLDAEGGEEFLHRYRGTYIGCKHPDDDKWSPMLVNEIHDDILSFSDATGEQYRLHFDEDTEALLHIPELGYAMVGESLVWTSRTNARIYKRGVDIRFLRYHGIENTKELLEAIYNPTYVSLSEAVAAGRGAVNRNVAIKATTVRVTGALEGSVTLPAVYYMERVIGVAAPDGTVYAPERNDFLVHNLRGVEIKLGVPYPKEFINA